METLYFQYHGTSGDIRFFKIEKQNNQWPTHVVQLVTKISTKTGVNYCIGIYQLQFQSFTSRFGEITTDRKGDLHPCTQQVYDLAFVKLLKLLY